MGLSTAQVSAAADPVVAFSNAVYTGRYACSAATFRSGSTAGDLLTAVIKYNPNGGGAYTAGTLIAGANTGGLPPSAPSASMTLTSQRPPILSGRTALVLRPSVGFCRRLLLWNRPVARSHPL